LKRGVGACALAGGLVLVVTGAAGPATGTTPRALSPATTTSTTSTTTTTTIPGSTAATATPLPLYEFTDSGTGALPWSANSLSALTGATGLVAGPRTAEGPTGQVVVAYATASHSLAFVEMTGASSTFTNLADQVAMPPAADAPVPFFDGAGQLSFVYVASSGDVILVVNDGATPANLARAGQFVHQPWLVRDLTAASVSPTSPNGFAATGELAALADGASDLVALRTTGNHLEVLTVGDARPFDVTAATAVAPSTLLGSNPSFVGAPRGGLATLAVASANGHLDVFTEGADDAWTATDLTATAKTPAITGDPATAGTDATLYVASLARTSSDVELDSYAVTSGLWSVANLTAKTAALATPGPPLAGRLAVTVAGSTLSVAGAAAGWGDLFQYARTGANGSWTVTDVSVTGGSQARTIGSDVATVDPGGSVGFFAGGVDSPAPAGVGIYDVPYQDLAHVVSDGWPIVGDTGGLGTTGAPWVHVPRASSTSTLAQAIQSSPDFTTGLAIQNAHQRETWLSFWTVSGPSSSELADPAGFQANGYAAGRAVAQIVDRYAANGLGLKPDWLILDPEGYPDNHSQIDGLDITKVTGNGSVVTVTTLSPTSLVSGDKVNLIQTGLASLNVNNAPITVLSANTFSFPSTLTGSAANGYVLATSGKVLNAALLAGDLTGLVNGWRLGIASVDPTLNAGIYTDEYEYTVGAQASSSVPEFMAIAVGWSAGGAMQPPVPISHSSNVLGYIEYNNECTSGLVQKQLNMLTSSPWSGRYNTVQFNYPGYCTPSTP
jgi:hypothetical protein